MGEHRAEDRESSRISHIHHHEFHKSFSTFNDKFNCNVYFRLRNHVFFSKPWSLKVVPVMSVSPFASMLSKTI